MQSHGLLKEISFNLSSTQFNLHVHEVQGVARVCEFPIRPTFVNSNLEIFKGFVIHCFIIVVLPNGNAIINEPQVEQKEVLKLIKNVFHVQILQHKCLQLEELERFPWQHQQVVEKSSLQISSCCSS